MTHEKGLFHKAAKDGHIDLLQRGTKRDLNAVDEDGMTPTHWAAYAGNLEALRIIVGRGGDPDKADLWGNTPLHFAAQKHRLNCVSFLVNFGANIWQVDNDGQSALEIAALHKHKDIVRFLDTERGRQRMLNPKTVQKKQEKAVADAAKRLKRWEKMVNKKEAQSENPSTSNQEDPVVSLKSLSGKFKQTLRLGRKQSEPAASALVVGEPDPTTGGRNFSDYVLSKKSTASSANSRASGKLTEIIYVNPQEEVGGGGDSGISVDVSPEPASLFDRPGFGSVSFRNLGLLQPSPYGSDDDDGFHEAQGGGSPLEVFLHANGLSEYVPLFLAEKLSLASLSLLSEHDLIQLQIPLGPRKLLIDALQRRRGLISQPGQCQEMHL